MKKTPNNRLMVKVSAMIFCAADVLESAETTFCVDVFNISTCHVKLSNKLLAW